MDLLLFIQLEGQFVPFGFVFSGSFIHNGTNIIHVAGEQGERGAHTPPILQHRSLAEPQLLTPCRILLDIKGRYPLL